jgi:GTP pyrophosphokinase
VKGRILVVVDHPEVVAAFGLYFSEKRLRGARCRERPQGDDPGLARMSGAPIFPPISRTLRSVCTRFSRIGNRMGFRGVWLTPGVGTCCKPMPPDAITGFVTRGKSISIHRVGRVNFRNMAARNPERVISAQRR